MAIQEVSVQRPGDVNEYKVTIDGQDVSMGVTKVELFFDLFTSWSCTLHFVDTHNNLINIPIKPSSRVEVTLGGDAPKPCQGRKTFKFRVFSIADKHRENAHVLKYRLICVNESLIKNQSTRIRKSYASMKPSDIATDVLKSINMELEVKETPDVPYSIIVPNWSPLNAAMWCTKVSRKGDVADFLLYMTDNEKYALHRIEKMFTDNKSGIKFIQKPQNFRENSTAIDEDSFISMQAYQFVHYDAMQNLSSGYHGSKIISHDIINKKIVTTEYNFSQELTKDQEKKSWDDPLLDNVADSHVTFIPRHFGLHESKTPFEDQDQWAQSRKSNLFKLEQERLIIQVPGNICLWEIMGKTVEVDMPRQEDFEDEEFDRNYKGDYLVIAQKHDFTKDSYMVNIDLAKKRMDKKLGE